MVLRLQIPRLTLTSRILALTLGLLLTVVAIIGLASTYLASQQIDREFRERSLTVASSIAALPEVRYAKRAGDPSGVLQPLAESVRLANGGLRRDHRRARHSVLTSQPNPAPTSPIRGLSGTTGGPLRSLTRRGAAGIIRSSLRFRDEPACVPA